MKREKLKALVLDWKQAHERANRYQNEEIRLLTNDQRWERLGYVSAFLDMPGRSVDPEPARARWQLLRERSGIR